jgi:hypothetical protein
MSLNLPLASNLDAKPSSLRQFFRQLPASFRRTHGASRASIVLSAVLGLLAMLTAPAFAKQDSPPAAAPAQSSPTYQPKFRGDPARSDSEAAALAYMRVVLRAQRQFNKQYGHFATSLSELVHSGSFTRRMVNLDRGDYIASFKGKNDSFVLTMTPKNLDAQHRSFYAEDDGKIHADETKPADASSPVVK